VLVLITTCWPQAGITGVLQAGGVSIRQIGRDPLPPWSRGSDRSRTFLPTRTVRPDVPHPRKHTRTPRVTRQVDSSPPEFADSGIHPGGPKRTSHPPARDRHYRPVPHVRCLEKRLLFI
jgi:hypothetical protein